MTQRNNSKPAPHNKPDVTDLALQKFTQWLLDVGESTARTFIETLKDVLHQARHKTDMAQAILDADDPQLVVALEKTAELETLLSMNQQLLSTIQEERAEYFEVMPGSETGRVPVRRYNSNCATRILRILNDSAAKMKETAPTLKTKLFKTFEGL
jgi:hypothetical protein